MASDSSDRLALLMQHVSIQNTTASAESGFLAIGSRLNLSAASVDDVRQSFANTNDRWLLVLDNADDKEVDYQQYFPTGCTGVIILTSRNNECRRYATRKTMALNVLPPHEARELLLKAADISTSQPEAYKQDADLVATSLLKGHPLALIQAGAYIAQGHCCLAEYPKIFQHQRQRLLTFRPGQARSRYGHVYATFEASADILQSSQSEASRHALQLLSILAMLASSRLPLSLFQVIWQGAGDIFQDAIENEDEDEDVGHLVTWHVSHLLPLIGANDEMWDSFRLVEAVQLLAAYSLVVVDGLGDAMSVTMHPLTHTWARDRQELKQQQHSWLTAGCMIAVSGGRRLFWQATQQQLQPHLQALLLMKASMMFTSGPHLMVARILLQCGWLLVLLRVDKVLFVLIQDVLTWLGLDRHIADEQWVEFYGLGGQNLSNHGKVKEAVALLEQVVRIEEQTLAADLPSRLASQHALAIAYRANEQVKEAVALLEQVVRIKGQTLAEDYPSRLASQHELARAYQANGQVKEAVSQLQEVVRIKEQTLVEDHPSRLASQHELAITYKANGQVKQAVALLQHVVRIEEQTLAEEHPLGGQRSPYQ